MRGIRAVPVALWVLGIALIADAVRRGDAHVALVVIVPVISGQSGEFLLGIVLGFAGFLTLPWLFVEREAPATTRERLPTEPTSPPIDGASHVGGGGLVLIGPIPILFGGWRHVSRRTRRWLAVVGGLILVVCVAAVVVALA